MGTVATQAYVHAVYGYMGAHRAVVHTCLCALALHIGNTTWCRAKALAVIQMRYNKARVISEIAIITLFFKNALIDA